MLETIIIFTVAGYALGILTVALGLLIREALHRRAIRQANYQAGTILHRI